MIEVDDCESIFFLFGSGSSGLGACPHFAFSEIGFVLHNLVKMIDAFSLISLHFSITAESCRSRLLHLTSNS